MTLGLLIEPTFAKYLIIFVLHNLGRNVLQMSETYFRIDLDYSVYLKGSLEINRVCSRFVYL